MAITNSSFVKLLLTCSILTTTQAFTISTPCTSTSTSTSTSSPLVTSSYHHYSHSSNKNTILHETTEDAIVSPFEEGAKNEDGKELLELTYDNVDMVLDDMRPYLIQDGGNVKIAEIDGPVVRLQLEGACGTCPSSTQTMKMGLERGLRERIPEIQEVIQAMPEGPALTADEVEIILDGVRPFLSVAGGTIDCESIMGEGSVQPVINLKMGGGSASLNSVKLEISQRLQRHFMLSGLKVEWM